MISIKKNEDITYHDLERIESHFFGEKYLIEVLRGNPNQYRHDIGDLTRYTEYKFLKDYEDGKVFVLKDNPFSPALRYIKEDKKGYWTLNSNSGLFFDSSVKWLARTVRPYEATFYYATIEEYRQIEETRYQETPLIDTTSTDVNNEENRKNLQINTKDKKNISKTNYKIKSHYLSEEINIINGGKPTYYFELKDNNGKTYKTKVKTANLKNKSINENFTLQELCKEVELPLAHLVSFFPQVKANYETRWIDPVSYASILINDSWKYNEPLNKIGEDRPEVKDVTSFKKGKNSLDETKLIQEGLLKMDIDLGDYGADGDYGSTTETAVKIFQEHYTPSYALHQYDWAQTPDGVVGKNTLLAMDEALVAGWIYEKPIMIWDKATIQKIESLHPKIKKNAEKFILAAQDKNIFLRITSSYRSIEEQNTLYLKGRTLTNGKYTKIGKTVTNAKGGESYHNFGLAIDVVEIKNKKALWTNDWIKIGKIGKSSGFEWGGDWKSFRDKPHFQITYGNSTKELHKKVINKDTENGYVKI